MIKQSLAAGVLDGGDKEVHLGGSRLAQFMDSVERVAPQPAAESAPVAQVDPPAVAAVDRESAEAAGDDTSDRQSGGDVNHSHDTWQALLAFAQTLLTEVVQPPGREKGRPSGGLVRRDPKTGERYLHPPVPDADRMTRLLDALRDVLAR